MNKKVKVIISAFMALIMVFSLLTVAPYAATKTMSLSTTDSSFEQGDKVVVTVKFDKYYADAAALDLGLKYDPNQLEVKSVTKGDVITKARESQSDGVYSETHATRGEVRWVFAGVSNYKFNAGVFATVEFVVSGRAQSGKTTVELVVNDAANSTYSDVKSTITSDPLNFNVIRSAESDMRFKYNSDETAYIITGYGSTGRDIVEIPSYHYGLPVIGIGNNAFINHSEIKAVIFNSPCTLQTIEANAFNGCDALETIAIPHSVTSIGNNAFDGCIALRNLTLSYSLTTIGVEAFNGCEVLEKVNLPFNLKEIKASAFNNCSKLATVNISKNTTTIDTTAFTGCAKLTFNTVADNTVIDTYNTEASLGATVNKTLNDISLGTANVPEKAILIKDGVYPEVTVTLTNEKAVTLGTDYEVVYLDNYKEGTARVIVAGIGTYSEGYNKTFTVTCNHDWEKTVAKAPTCLLTGLYDLKCKICDKEDTEVINATGHQSTTWVIDRLPTITDTGLKHKVCMVDRVKFEENTVIPKVVPDADRDGKVSSSDALIVLQYTVGIDNTLTVDTLLQVDCNGDGKANSLDALTILRIVVGDIVVEGINVGTTT